MRAGLIGIGLTSLVCGFLVGVSTPSASDAPEGMPDRDRLIELAKSHGVDVYAEMDKAYKGERESLTKVLGLSSHFNTMDPITRVYGNLVYASFLNLGEDKGVFFFAEAIAPLEPGVRQRVRDFIYYAVTKVPKRHRAEVEQEVRRDYAVVFPSDYVFGQGNPLFD